MSRTDYPVSTDFTMYIEGYHQKSMLELLMLIESKWPNVNLDQVTITPEYRHVEAVDYDLYDSTDYINYLVITKDT